MGTQIFTMQANGEFRELKKMPNLEIGTIVYSFGPGMTRDKWAVYTNNNDVVKLSPCMDNYFNDPFRHLDQYTRPIKEKFGIGFYYDLEAEKSTKAEIDAAIERANAYILERKLEKERAEQARKEAIERVLQEYGDKYEKSKGICLATHVAKNVRKDLKLHFKGCKFSVKSDNYRGITISWTDGASEKDVKRVADKHRLCCSRDRWNDDLWDHTGTAFTEVYGGVETICYERSISTEKMQPIIDDILSICPDLRNNIHHHDAFEIEGFSKVYDEYSLDKHNGLYWYSATEIARLYLKEHSFIENK